MVKRQAKKLIAEGHEVIIITTAAEGDHIWQDEGKTVYRFRPKNIYYYKEASKKNFALRLVWQFVNMFNYSAARQIKNILQKEKPDIVHTHNLMGVSFLIPKVIKNLKIKHYHTLHDVQLVEPSGIIMWQTRDSIRYKNIFAYLYTYFCKKLFGSPEQVFAPSQFIKDFYKSKGFFPDSKWQVDEKPIFNPKENFNKNKFIFVGALTEHKGIKILMQAWDKLEKEALLTIVGGGDLESKVSKWAEAKNNVNFLGKKDNKEVQEIYASHSTLIFPSLAIENRPTVIVEALAKGLSVIATDTGGTKELLEENEKLKLIEAGNVKELREAIERRIE